MSGIVYEDTQTPESASIQERLGNGRKDGNEKGVQNVKVELLDEKGDIAYLYYKDTSTESGANRKPAITYTKEDGKYSFGEAGASGIIVGNYSIRYTYGNEDKGTDGDGTAIGKTTIDGGSTFVNARNYKSTIITEQNIKKLMTGESNSDNWYLDMDEGVDASIAIDNIEQRKAQDTTLKYENFNNEQNMSSTSKAFSIKIEYTKGNSAKVDENGGDLKHDWSTFDFGIIERPRENVIINKTISRVKLTLSNGQILFEGDPRKDKLNYVKAIGIEQREKAKYASIDAAKTLSIEMDQELVQGSTLEVWYLIQLTNDSEKDYDYSINSNYYNYGTDKQGNPLGLADLVVDYMDSLMICNVGENFNAQNVGQVDNREWFRSDNGATVDAEYLKNNGYISYKLDGETDDKTYETINKNNLQSIATRTFENVLPGETKTSEIYASKILANQDNSNSYVNHVEIIALNGKTARTIKEVVDNNKSNTQVQESSYRRTQIGKSYKPGDYIPTLSSNHEQDDDRVNITITPPTGTTNYTTIYIISTMVGLIVITGAVILIKKYSKNK